MGLINSRVCGKVCFRGLRCSLELGHRGSCTIEVEEAKKQLAGRYDSYTGAVHEHADTSGIPRLIDTQPTSPTISVPDLTIPELAAIQIALQEQSEYEELGIKSDETGCALCHQPMSDHPIKAEFGNDETCEYFIDPDFNAYQDSDDE